MNQARESQATELFSLNDLKEIISDFIDSDWEIREAVIVMLHDSAQRMREKAAAAKIEQWKQENNIRFIEGTGIKKPLKEPANSLRGKDVTIK